MACTADAIIDEVPALPEPNELEERRGPRKTA